MPLPHDPGPFPGVQAPLTLTVVGGSWESSPMDLDNLLDAYLVTRGLEPEPFVTKGSKILEESRELVRALRVYRVEPTEETFQRLMDEVADVVLAVAVLARQEDFTIEEAIQAKTERDRGRGYKPNDSARERSDTHPEPPC